MKIVPFVLVIVGGLASILGGVYQKRTVGDLRVMRDTDGQPYVDDVNQRASSWAFWLIIAGVLLGVAAGAWSLLG